ncbi:MAG TPA: alpha-L-arabinofuranosidase C-terminal domain-containing protein [Fimbriimonas sp.]|nr:alpha-L-arabinofuranosidase C-terminal domain-containing protein [Fimbriimonas sp.]
MTTVRIHEDEPYGQISPRLYGHFAEHLGRCCYNGLWVGPASPIPNIEGFRTDIVEAFQAMRVPLLRWPGGCYADHYHWRDGVGNPSERPVRLGMSCGLQVRDDNSLGTHEFLRFCELIGAEPYLAGNVGSGSVQELCDWVEYCNAPVQTDLAQERGRNGRTQPFGVKLWGVGNENWGCGGNYEAESYGLEYRRYAGMLRHVDPTAELVVCGHDSHWNARIIQTLRNHIGLVDHFSIHRYWIDCGPGVDFTEEDYYRSVKEADATEKFVQETRALLDEVDPKGRVGIALDEWGVWHPEARPWGPGGKGDETKEYFQAATLRDAVLVAVALEGFHRQCASLSMANLAQIVNVLHAPIQTSGAQMWLTPTYHVLRMSSAHIGQQAIRTSVEGSSALPDGSPSVSATASVGEEGPVLTITNRHFTQPAELQVPNWAAVCTLLSGPSANAENSAGQPHHVQPKSQKIGATLELPPFSVAILQSAR